MISAPMIDNPACQEVLYSFLILFRLLDVVNGNVLKLWTLLTRANGGNSFTLKFSAPLIDNPAYKGEWAPRKIANPNYFEDLKPSNFAKIGAVGFELWTLSSDILFDNIYIGHSEGKMLWLTLYSGWYVLNVEKIAAALAKETYSVKAAIEKAKNPEPEKVIYLFILVSLLN